MKSASENTIGAAVVGLGVGREHALAYNKSPESRLRAISDIDLQKARALQAELGSEIEIKTFDEILRDTKIEIVSIATYDNAHASQIISAFNSKKAVFVEKPLCQTAEELTAIHKSWHKNGKPALGSNLVLRGAEIFIWLKQAIKENKFGKIYAADGDYLYGRIHKISEGWRKDMPYYSVFEGGAIHMLDLILWLLEERPATVMAQGNRIATRETLFKFNDFVAAQYFFPSGIIGRVAANFGCVHRHQHLLRIYGTKATFIMDDQGPRVFWSREENGVAEKMTQSVLPLNKGVLIPHFLEIIKTKKGLETLAQQEFDLMAAVLAADESLSRQETVEVQYCD